MNIDKRLLAQILAFLKPFLITIVSGWLGGAAIVFQALLLSRIIAGVFVGKQDLSAQNENLYGLLYLIILRAAFVFVQSLFAKQLGIKVKSTLRAKLISALFKDQPLRFQDQKSGELATLAMQGIDSLDAYFSQYLPQLILAVVIPVTILITVFPLDLLTGIILLLTAPLIPLFMVLIGQSAERLTGQQWRQLKRLGTYFLDTIQGLPTLKVNSNDREGEKISAASEQYRQVTLKVLRVTFLSALVLEIVATISTAIVAVQIGLRLLNGQIAYQQALFLLVLAPEFYLPLRTLGARFHAGMTAMNISNQLFAWIGAPQEESLQSRKKVQRPQISAEPIRFQSITVHYPERNDPAVEDLSFSIEPGIFTALAGHSGAGKTTIMNLLLRFIEPASGNIMVGNINLMEISPDDWRRLISWVPQNPFVFQATLAENIHLSSEASRSKLESALEQANLFEFAASLPAGLNTAIGEQGFGLSGGEVQRLALARAFYRDSPILLLDEPTSYIDPQNAREIQDIIRQISRNRTTIMIAHHDVLLSAADHLIVLQRGKLLTSGDPKTILQQRLSKPLKDEIASA